LNSFAIVEPRATIEAGRPRDDQRYEALAA
jgi:hypothetical protein